MFVIHLRHRFDPHARIQRVCAITHAQSLVGALLALALLSQLACSEGATTGPLWSTRLPFHFVDRVFATDGALVAYGWDADQEGGPDGLDGTLACVDAGRAWRVQLGLGSILVGIAVPTGLCLLLAALYAANKITYNHDVKEGLATLLGLYFFVLAPLGHVVGLVLGVGGLFQRGARLSAALGALLNLALPPIGAFLFLFGLALVASSGVR